ncbi:MAG: sigma-54-dependent Fis family transcriptional regulator [Myxococcales bacterium]|nr:sigma-54-dependent Fis family transcriptional regulator [Myxococcales bacterium]MCB9520036.1 sigma-54-dependent Fis family transcriptional regulator [Myxococcales bacterium]
MSSSQPAGPQAAAPVVLIVDDDVEHAATLDRLLRREGLETRVAHDVVAALDALRKHGADLVLTDLVMPGKSGLDLLAAVRQTGPRVPVILMTAFGTIERAVQAMHAGAADFVVKPIRRANLVEAVERALETRRLRSENAALREQLDALTRAPLIGSAPTFRSAVALAHQVAASDATVVLLGESGTGKELFAREIHRQSARSGGPFVAVQCGALPDSIVESELFGHEAGAFTGAVRRRAGLFEAAHGGTVLLDEVGELPLAAQVKLLRVLQEREVVRVGGTAPVPVDVRVIAATHRALDQMVARGDFRQDLFYRLDVVSIRVPPLRERLEDVPRLAAHLAAKHAGAPRPLSRAAVALLQRHRWPGNVRELENAIERAVVLDSDGLIDVDDLPPGLGDHPPESATVTLPVGTTLAEAERQLILATLAQTAGDKAVAATILGVGRRTIYRKLDEYAADAADD